MTKRFVLAALLAAAAPGFAQAPVTAPAVTAPKADLVRVALDTEKGRIVLELDQGKAPVTTKNFLAYVDKGWLNGEPFYRAMPYGEGGLVQGGVRNGSHQLPPIAVETTGIKNVAGAIAMANAGPNTTRSDFFIMLNDIPAFDGPSGFAAFGRVVEGMDVVKAIFAAPRSPTKGEGVMKGQMLDPTIKITKAARLKP